MKLRLTERLRRSYEAAPKQVKKAFDKQAHFLLHNLQYPSLRAKKYDPGPGRLASASHEGLALLLHH